MPEHSSSTKRAVRTSLYMQSVHEQLVQRETGPEWTAAAPATARPCIGSRVLKEGLRVMI